MLYRTNLKVQQLNSDPYKSFEFKELLLHSDNCISRIIMVYRPPFSVKNGRTHAGFFFLSIFHATGTPSVLSWKFTLKWRFQFPC